MPVRRRCGRCSLSGDFRFEESRVAAGKNLALHRARNENLDDVKWTTADAPLLDEARFVLGPRLNKLGKIDEKDEIRTYGHIVIDEVQDLTPMVDEVRALEPSRLWRLDLKRFQALKQQGSPVAWKIVRNVALQVCDRFRATNQLLELDLNAPRPEVTASTTGMPAIRIDAGVAPVTTSPRGGVWDTLRGFFGGA